MPRAAPPSLGHHLSNFTPTGLHHHAARLVAAYAAARPFPHTYIDGLFPDPALEAVASEIPEAADASGCVPGAAACYRKVGTHYRKSELHREAMGPSTRQMFETLRSAHFVRFLEALSGIRGLVPDPGYEGSGVHLTGNGGVLAVHHDFNWMYCAHDALSGTYSACSRPRPYYQLEAASRSERRVRLHRRVNVFIYLNRDWRDDFGGHLELWARNMSRCEQRILPSFGRFAVFSSTDFSFHGHPTPMRLPPGRMRRSIAFYYYTPHRPAEECEDADCESFRNAVWKRLGGGCTSCTACAAPTARREQRERTSRV